MLIICFIYSHSEICKTAGLNLKELSLFANKPESTLIRWHKENYQLCELLVRGAASKKLDDTLINLHIK